MVAEHQPISVKEFMALPNDGNRHELVRGALRVMPPSKGKHGVVEAAIIAAIDRYLYGKAQEMGWTPEQGLEIRQRLVGVVGGGELGMLFSVPDDPHMIRGADVAYLSAEQLASASWDAHEYFPGVPTLTIEILNDNDRASAVAEKVQDYLAGGGHHVWCIYPDQKAVHIHDADAPTRVICGNTVVTDEILPGFTLPLNLIFS